MSNFTDFFPAASGGGGGGIPKYQEFTSSGTFTPTQALIDAGGRVAYLIVGGGERGDSAWPKKWGGAGGQVKVGYMTLTSTTGCAVTIGAGGSGSAGANGGNSSVAFNSAGGTAVTANGGSGLNGTSNGSNHGAWSYGPHSYSSSASAHPGFFGGYGAGGGSDGDFAGGTTSGIANMGNGGMTSDAGSGFVRITWFE